MSRWSTWDQYRSEKRPPPEHGLKIKKVGATWWGVKWIEALENLLGADMGRLKRGRTYARTGRVHDLTVKDGEIAALVTGSAPRPYQIAMTVAQLSGKAWDRAIAAMATKAQFAAELLAGVMPQNLDELFRDADTSLFPESHQDLRTSCTCPDHVDPCKHVAATHYVLGDAFDGDPFLLFELRGRGRSQVLDALRAARGGGKSKAGGGAPAVPKVSLGKIDPADYDRPREPLPALNLTFEAPAIPGAMLRQLGTPAAWRGELTPAELLAPLVGAAAERARRIALQDPEPPAPVAEKPKKAAKPKKPKQPR